MWCAPRDSWPPPWDGLVVVDPKLNAGLVDEEADCAVVRPVATLPPMPGLVLALMRPPGGVPIKEAVALWPAAAGGVGACCGCCPIALVGESAGFGADLNGFHTPHADPGGLGVE